MKNLETYFSSAREREAIRRRRESGEAPPWTKDPVLGSWRFCNVHRENDRVTRWLRENVRGPLSDDRERLVVAVAAFRWFNRIDVGEIILDVLLGGWDGEEVRRRLSGRIGPVTNAAYMVNTPPGFDKLDGVIKCVDDAMAGMVQMAHTWGASLEDAWRGLRTLPRVGSFVAYEIVTDLRWTPVLRDAEDIMTWAAAGPGCAQGLGYLVADDPGLFAYGSARDQREMNEVMRALVTVSRYEPWWPGGYDPWEMREAEMWACEYAKWRKGCDGRRLKRKYSPEAPELFSMEGRDEGH